MSKKLLIKKRLEEIYLSGKTPDEIIELMQELKGLYLEPYYTNLEICIEAEPLGDWDAIFECFIQGNRLETDVEYLERKAFEARRDKEIEEMDRQTYERLRAKFQG